MTSGYGHNSKGLHGQWVWTQFKRVKRPVGMDTIQKGYMASGCGQRNSHAAHKSSSWFDSADLSSALHGALIHTPLTYQMWGYQGLSSKELHGQWVWTQFKRVKWPMAVDKETAMQPANPVVVGSDPQISSSWRRAPSMAVLMLVSFQKSNRTWIWEGGGEGGVSSFCNLCLCLILLEISTGCKNQVE